MNELSDQLGAILNDPEQMARINRLAQSLLGGGDALEGSAPVSSAAGEEGPDSAMLSRLGSLLGQSGDQDQRALLEAIKPYLSEKRRGRLDRAMRLTRMAKLARLALGEMGNGETL